MERIAKIPRKDLVPVVLSDEAIANNIAEFQYAQAHCAWHQDANT